MKTCEKCGLYTNATFNGELVSNCTCLETFDWLTAAKLIVEGKQVEEWINNEWNEVFCSLHKSCKYRIKPTPPPDVVRYANDYENRLGFWREFKESCDVDYNEGKLGIIKKTTKPDGNVTLEHIPKEK